jgi:hypothetical protein
VRIEHRGEVLVVLAPREAIKPSSDSRRAPPLRDREQQEQDDDDRKTDEEVRAIRVDERVDVDARILRWGGRSLAGRSCTPAYRPLRGVSSALEGRPVSRLVPHPARSRPEAA